MRDHWSDAHFKLVPDAALPGRGRNPARSSGAPISSRLRDECEHVYVGPRIELLERADSPDSRLRFEPLAPTPIPGAAPQHIRQDRQQRAMRP
jgi:hypothetical protein